MQTSVLEYLENSAERFPDKVAFFDQNSEITYARLRTRALDLAFFIKESVAGRRNPVLVYLPKAVDSITAFLGVLYSGNFYTPADTEFPSEKVKGITDALRPKAVLVNTETREKLRQIEGLEDAVWINVDECPPCGRYEDSRELVDAVLDVDPVYVFFTSGSTGVPKGVIINNHSLIDFTDWITDKLEINSHTVFGNQAPFHFDMSNIDIYPALKTGAATGIIPPAYFSFPIKVLEFIRERNINTLQWVPSAYISVSNFDLLKKVSLDKVETIIFGGEVMPASTLNYWRKNLPNLKTAVNLYGPTEATVYCGYYIVDREFSESEVIPLGRARENAGLLVMDENGQPVDENMPNVLGELCVYGSSLADGYWMDAEKTKERFIDNPYNPYCRQKMYLTGDLVYYNERGELVFSGRKDSQIKHLGYRIELGEIEAALLSIDFVGNACCLYDNENSEIVAFCQAQEDKKKTDIRKAMAQKLPKYMLPAKYYLLSEMPLNANGKIDRKELRKRMV